MSEPERRRDHDEAIAIVIARSREGKGPPESFDKLVAALERGDEPKVDPDRPRWRSIGLPVGVGIVGALVLGAVVSLGGGDGPPARRITSTQPSARASAPANAAAIPAEDAPAASDVPSLGVRDLPSSRTSSSNTTKAPGSPSAVGSNLRRGAKADARLEVRSPSTLRRELELIQRARGTLAAGDGSGCVVVLDAYAREFPSGQFAVETRVLRIEALARTGARAVARQGAEAFLTEQPNSPYAERIRLVLQALEGQ